MTTMSSAVLSISDIRWLERSSVRPSAASDRINGLDPEGIRWIRQFMRSLAAEGRTVLLSSRLMSEMASTADELVVIGQGRLLAQGSVARLTAGHASLEDAYFHLTQNHTEYHAQGNHR